MNKLVSIPSDVKEEVNSTVASTIIRFTADDRRRCAALFRQLKLKYIPSDIIESNTVPIRNLAIECDFSDSEARLVTKRYDVFVLDRERFGDDNAVVVVGYDDEMKYRYCNLLSIEDGMITSNYLDCDDPEEAQKFIALMTFMAYWYFIQVSLLHPTIKEVFRHSGILTDKDRAESKAYKKRPLYYQKSKMINQIEFDEAIKRCIVRKTLIWYVIGHWRNYKDGRRIFIQPYWKGALRETKMTEVPRERVI